jgi:hypothetical protein
MPRDIKFLSGDLKKLLESVVTKEMLEEIGQRIVDIIYKRTKAGKGLDSDSNKVGGPGLAKLKPLSETYKERRKKDGVVGKFGSANRSNLTNTGQMLDAIVYKIARDTVIVELPATSRDDGLDNKKVADYVTKNGRPFFGIASTEAKTLDSFIRRLIRERLRELNR